MAFGPIMQMNIGDLQIELAPIEKEKLHAFISPGLQQASVSKYLAIGGAPVLEDEQEWFEKVRTDKNAVVWGIWHREGSERRLIGSTALEGIERHPLNQATSGSLIVDRSYWGRGIASAIHKARTWYAFEQLGLVRLKSAVIHGNIASKKALEKSGYTLVYTERNTAFIDGVLRHQDNLECLNPADWAWSRWWGDDTPTESSQTARTATKEALAWARQNVVVL
ncbi:MAG TPA: GNAT family protein [Candidatus Saccharimonadales bacterium]|nr:GNAT family protein [Candidatus Saccharimonadales bacterium]